MKNIEIINPRIAPGGIRLRDYFAGKAMQALLQSGRNYGDLENAAYEFADAMLIRRGRTTFQKLDGCLFDKEPTPSKKPPPFLPNDDNKPADWQRIEVGDMVRIKGDSKTGLVQALGYHQSRGIRVQVGWESGDYSMVDEILLELVQKGGQK